MEDNPVINLVILLSFTYFIGSLMISALNEVIASRLSLRNKTLQQGLLRLFFHEDWKKYIRTEFQNSPFIQSLQRKNKRYPAYIPARNFAQTVLFHCSLDAESLTTTQMLQKVRSAECPLPSSIKQILEIIILQTDGIVVADKSRLDLIQTHVEEFYNSAMDRVSGWYKRKIRKISFILSLSLAVILNIDTVKITNDTLRNPQQLRETASKISEGVLSGHIAVAGDSVIISDTAGRVVIRTAVKSPAADNSKSASSELIKDLAIVYEQYAGYRLGYVSWKEAINEWSGMNFFIKLMGVLLTTFALQLGSNYWFDLLNKAVNIRAAGKKPLANEKIV